MMELWEWFAVFGVAAAIVVGTAPVQAVAGIGAVLLMAIALAAVVHRTRTRVARLEPDAVLLLGSYGILIGLVWAGST